MIRRILSRCIIPAYMLVSFLVAKKAGGILFLMLCSSLASLGCSRAEEAAAVLKLRGTSTQDFGKCHQGDVLEHEFCLVNAGTALSDK